MPNTNDNVLDEARQLVERCLAELHEERRRLERALAELGGKMKRPPGPPRKSASSIRHQSLHRKAKAPAPRKNVAAVGAVTAATRRSS